MARGKYLSLEEARKQGKLERFAKEHETKGDKRLFDETLKLMAPLPVKKPKSGGRTSKKG